MRVVVHPHTMEIGGSQLNAVECAAAVRDLGHDVLVYGRPGALVATVERLGLEFVESPDPGRRPSRPVMRHLGALVRERGVDVVHTYEWTTTLDAYFGPRLRGGVTQVCTVMSMAVAPFVPRDVPLLVGTEQIAAYERSRGRALTGVLEPPVDVTANAPGAADGEALRASFGIAPDEIVLVSVSRLAAELKLEGLLTAVEVVAALADTYPVRLLVVGDGPAAALVRERAQAANARAGRPVVLLAGELADPRPAYAAADVSLGMGGSALRAMAFGTPLVVQGERGFWERLTPQNAQTFLWTGWYGVGGGADEGAPRLHAALEPLLADAELRRSMGAYGRQLAVDRFSLERAGRLLVREYEAAVAARTVSPKAAVTGAGGYVTYQLRRRWHRLRGTEQRDDFNAVPVAALPALPGPAQNRPQPLAKEPAA